MSIISMILVVLVAFLAGMEGILDGLQSHQLLVAYTLIDLVTGNLEAGIVLDDTPQMIALGWTNIGAAVTPDAALASVASAIILVLGEQDVRDVPSAIAIVIPSVVTGLFLTMIVRAVAVPIAHLTNAAAEEGSTRKAEMWYIIAVCLQEVHAAVPAVALLFVPAQTMQSFLELTPARSTDDMAIGGGMVVAVDYALAINMMATEEIWPFFVIGFVVVVISRLTLIALGALGIALALIYLNLFKMDGSSNNGGGSNSGSPSGDILNDY